jgi:ATP-dependent helicase/nuclease subunit B
LAIAQAVLTEFTGNPRVAAFWVPRFQRFAEWFAETEPARREGTQTTCAELRGSHVLAGPAGAFTLTARADRIDLAANGVIITDYKTAADHALRTLAGRAERGEAPQLPLEAMIQMGNGFQGIAASPVTALRYISASGGEPPGVEIALRKDDVAALARDTEQGLVRLIRQFDEEKTPYRAVRRAQFNYEYDDYAHLARVAEWLAAEGGEE